MSEPWNRIQLGKACEIILGQSPSSDTYNQDKKGLPFFQGKSEFGSKYAQAKTWCSDPIKIANKNDILISVRAPVGEANLAPGICCIGRGLAALRADQENLLQEFLWHQIEFKKVYLQGISQGSTFDAISGKDLSELQIELPPLPEQKKIAEILSGVDRSIAINIHKITSLKTLYTSLLADSLKKLPGDCLEMQLSDACSDVFLGLTSKVDYVESEGIPLIRASNIKNGLIDFNSALHISRDQHLSLTKYRKAERGDVLVTKSGSLGECAIVQAEKEFSIYESIICLKPRSDILTTEYLFHAMQCSAVKNQFLSGRVGSAVAHLNLSAFRRITIPVPSLASQKAISKALDAVQSTRDLLRIDTDKKCFLKDALSSDLLSGRKRVTV